MRQKLVEHARIEREARECRHLERCAGKPLGNSKRLTSECKVIRPAAAVADRVLAELAAQGPSPLLEDEESTPEFNEESRLDQACDACIDNSAGNGDSRDASTEQRADLAAGEHELPDLRANHGLTREPAPTPAIGAQPAKGRLEKGLAARLTSCWKKFATQQ